MKPLLLPAALFLLILPALASAQSYYIRDGAAGTSCSDWGTNACDSLPSALQRGATYYIADGSYGGYTFDDAESGTQLITIRKATASDHGTNTGWSSSYGDGQAVFAQTQTFLTGFYKFDGVTGGGPGSWNRGFGFKVHNTGTAISMIIGWKYHSSSQFKAVPNVTISHTEFTAISGNWVSAIDLGTSTMTKNSNITLEYLYFDPTCEAGSRIRGNSVYLDNLLVQYCYFKGGNTDVDHHFANIRLEFGSGGTIRYNIFEDFPATGGIGNYQQYSDAKIYGNVFVMTPGFVGTYSKCIYTNSCQSTNYACTQTGWRIYDNSFINIYSPQYIISFPYSPSDNLVYNNIFYEPYTWSRPPNRGGTTSDYNWFYPAITHGEAHSVNGTGDPFIDWENGDFRLSAATAAGYILPSPYNADFNGVIRGADGNWDRGALEYTGSPTPINGQCGTSLNSCTAGTLNDIVDNTTHYLWQCLGLNGGTTASCSLVKPVPDCSSQGYYCCPSGYACSQPASGTGCSGTCCASQSTCSSPSQYFLPEQYVQGELGILTGMQTGVSGSDTYIYTNTANSGSASFTFQINNPGKYRMEARLLTQSIGQNSFYVGLDSEAANGNNSYAYDAMLSSTTSFEWDNVSLRGPNGLPESDEFDPMFWDLTQGTHTFTFYGRESNTWLDQIILRRIQSHKSDSNSDGCVDNTELSAFISLWYLDSSNPTLKELIEAIGLWKRGGC